MEKRQTSPGGKQAQFVARLPEGVRERLREVAAGNRRSMNSELVMIMERALFDPLESEATRSKPAQVAAE